jgi:prophage regulatory protein
LNEGVDVSTAIKKLISAKAVREKLGIGNTTLYRYINSNLFPKPIKLGPKKNRWYEEDVAAWIEQRKRKGNAA